MIMADSGCDAIQLEAENNRQLEYGRILTLAQNVHNAGENDCAQCSSTEMTPAKPKANDPAKQKTAPLAQKPKKVMTDSAVKTVELSRMLLKYPPLVSA